MALRSGTISAATAAPPVVEGSPSAEDQPPPSTEPWAVHGQITNVTQGHPSFRSPYSGPNSLLPDGRTEETTDATLFVACGRVPSSG